MLTNCGNNYLESYYFKQNSFLVTIINTRLFSSSPTDGRQQFNFLPGESRTETQSESDYHIHYEYESRAVSVSI